MCEEEAVGVADSEVGGDRSEPEELVNLEDLGDGVLPRRDIEGMVAEAGEIVRPGHEVGHGCEKSGEELV